jgi:hypothetical protein
VAVITQPKTDEPSADELEALIEEARQRQRRRQLGYLLVGFVSLALIAGLAMLFESAGEDRASGGSATAQGPGAPRADSLYLRVNTTPRLVSVNPQTGRTSTLPVVLPCGDTPFCLIGSGDRLVISGVGRTVALDPSGDTKPKTSGIGHSALTGAREGLAWDPHAGRAAERHAERIPGGRPRRQNAAGGAGARRALGRGERLRRSSVREPNAATVEL